jgi:hypothetical protein
MQLQRLRSIFIVLSIAGLVLQSRPATAVETNDSGTVMVDLEYGE